MKLENNAERYQVLINNTGNKTKKIGLKALLLL